jgi:lysozyme
MGLEELLSFDQETKNYVKDNEGYNPNIYDDTKNIPTTGYGFNTKAAHVRKHIPRDVLNKKRALTRQESDSIFEKVYSQAVVDAEDFVTPEVFNNLPNNQKKVLIDMSYNMGATSLRKFKNMRTALQSGNTENARKELLDSEYARTDVPDRAMRNADLMTGSNNEKNIPYREPHQSELDYFSQNKNVGGMATEDGKVIINPYTNLSDKEKKAVAMNEYSRLEMWKGKRPTFELTPEQRETFKDYGSEQDIRETVVGRIVSGDPSAGNITPEQKDFATNLFNKDKLSDLSTFEKAFAEARKAKKKIFEFEGKKFTTEVK